MHRNAGAYTAEAWTLYDKATGRDMGTKAYPTLKDALETMAHLLQVASTVSTECRQEVVERCDIRRIL